jgi:hypothetical protein
MLGNTTRRAPLMAVSARDNEPRLERDHIQVSFSVA